MLLLNFDLFRASRLIPLPSVPQLNDQNYHSIDFDNAHEPASLLKKFLRDLSEPLIPDAV